MERSALNTDAARLGRANIIHTYVALAGTVPGATLTRCPGCLIAAAPTDLAFCNFGIDLELDGEDLDPAGVEALRDHAMRHANFRVFNIPTGVDDDAGTALTKAGFLRHHRLAHMRHHRLAHMVDDGSGLKDDGDPVIEPARHPHERVKLAEFMVAQFFWRQATWTRRHIVDATAGAGHDLYRLGPLTDPTAAVMLARTPQTIGLYNLCVRQDLRNRGFGKAVVRAVQRLARSESATLVLQCEPRLEAWYAHLGFRTIGKLESFALDS